MEKKLLLVGAILVAVAIAPGVALAQASKPTSS